MQCFGSESDPRWIRFSVNFCIRIANADPDPEGENQPKKRRKIKYEDQK
jgi:hypothetical protein